MCLFVIEVSYSFLHIYKELFDHGRSTYTTIMPEQSYAKRCDPYTYSHFWLYSALLVLIFGYERVACTYSWTPLVFWQNETLFFVWVVIID
jgi:hypothetical protein